MNLSEISIAIGVVMMLVGVGTTFMTMRTSSRKSEFEIMAQANERLLEENKTVRDRLDKSESENDTLRAKLAQCEDSKKARPKW